METIKQALLLFLLLSGLTGLVYPICVTALSQSFFPHQANGSLIRESKNGNILGSELIGQEFKGEKYFWGRPSATSGRPYNAGASCGSNLGPNSRDLLSAVKERAEQLNKPKNSSPLPVDLLTTSGSGLDPHISIAAAQFQVERVAKARGITGDKLSELIRMHTEDRQFGLLGEPRVNVLKLNLALDGKHP